MFRYSLSRILLFSITLWLLSIFTFALNYWYPGDPLTNMSGVVGEMTTAYQQESINRAMDSTIFRQYGQYIAHLVEGNWGISLSTQEPVFTAMRHHLGASLELIILGSAVAIVLGLPLGTYAALRQRQWQDKLIMTLSLSTYSIPVFWFAQLAILLFAIQLGWSPIAGQIHPLYAIETQTGSILLDIILSDVEYRGAAFINALQHLWLPTLVVALIPLTMLIRMIRSAVLDTLQLNHIKAARVRGLSDTTILFKHVLPTAIQPVLREAGLQFSVLVTNIIIVEVVFNWPGLGGWLVKSIFERDYPVLQGGLLCLAMLILVANFTIDLLHAWRYPQTRDVIDAD